MKRAVIALLFLASCKATTCPTTEDLETGVVFQSGELSIQAFNATKHFGNGLYWVSQQSSLFPDRWHQFHYLGAFKLYTQRQSGSARQTTVYDAPIGDFDDIQSGTSFETTAQWGDPAGTQIWSADVTVTVEDAEPFAIGTCSYQSMTILTEGELTLPSGEQRRYSKRQRYLPELRYAFERAGTPVKVFVSDSDDFIVAPDMLRDLVAGEPALSDIFDSYDLTP